MDNTNFPLRMSELSALEQAKGIGYLIQPVKQFGGRPYKEWWAYCASTGKPYLTVTQDRVKNKAIIELDLLPSGRQFSKSTITEFKKNSDRYQIRISTNRLRISGVPLYKSPYMARQILKTIESMTEPPKTAE